MMMLTNTSFFVLFFMIFMIAFVSFVGLKRKQLSQFFMWKPIVFGVLITLSTVFVYSLFFNDYQQANFSFQNVMVSQSDIEEIDIVKTNQKNELREITSNEVITYVVDQKPYVLEPYQPVYLKSFDLYHFVVYSTKHYEELKLFQQNDFYQVNQADTMVLIHKQTGRLIPIVESELTGMKIVLDDITLSGDTLLLPIPRRYDIKPIFFRSFTLNPFHIKSGTPNYYYDRFVGFEHYDTVSTCIKHYALSDDQILLWVNDLGDVFLEQQTVVFGESTSSSQTIRRPDTALNDIQHIKDGAFEVVNGDIYYLDDDMNIYKIVTLDFHMNVGKALTLDNWTSYIT